jgi:hypothetical protein
MTSLAGLTLLLMAFTIGGLGSTDTIHAEGGTITLELGDQDFADGSFTGSAAAFDAASVGEPAPFDTFRGNNFDAGDPFTATWTHTFDPANVKGASLEFGICDHDSAAPGDQVASFVIAGIDLTAQLNAVYNGGGGTQTECNTVTIVMSGDVLAGGQLTTSLTLQGPSLGGDAGTTDTTLPGNGAGLDFSRLSLSVNKAVVKNPNLANLWLCNQDAPACENKESGVEGVNLDVDLNAPIGGLDPKCTGFPNFADPSTCDPQTIGSFEFEVRYDAKFVDVDVSPGGIWEDAGVPVECSSIEGEGFEQFRCNTKGKPIEGGVTGPGTLAVVHVTPTADVYSILVANQLNGIATQLINQDCQLSDTQGHPILLDGSDTCTNAAVTIRYLEGDVHADCVIDVRDQQQIAFRWGSALGQLLYNSRYDLEPSYPKATDGDIDAKDLQLVYGRAGSTCKDPHPAQDPVDPKSKEGEPPI